MKTQNRIKEYHPEAWADYCARQRWEAMKNQPLPDCMAFVPIDAPAPEPSKSPFFTLEELKAQAWAEAEEIVARSYRRKARRRKRKAQS